MASLNKVLLIGNLTREPELRYTPGGAAVCELGMAVNRRFVSNGQEKEETCFVDIVVWGKQAETCQRILQKGAPTFVEGRLQYEQWQDKETNAKRSRLRVVGERVLSLSRNQSQDRDYEGGGDYDSQEHAPSQQDDLAQRRSAPPQNNYQRPPAQQQGARPPSYQPRPQQRPPSQYNGGSPAPAQQQPPPMPDGAFEVEANADDDIPF
ncbi:MAG: hypothetical protein A2X49_07405 [Lentisphaerae bacterium GWF2_52_8]|nr:MAG: hypothetical protein A2X49_07405 [Lentisphaerae bacterium GWF2_52_8]